MKLKFEILILLMIFIACGNGKDKKNSQRSSQDDLLKNEQKDTVDSIYVKFEPGADFRLDILSVQSDQVAVKPQENFKAYFFDKFSNLIYFPIPTEVIYPISPGDSLIISSKNNLPFIKVLNNKKYTERELNLAAELSDKSLSIFEYLFKRKGTPEDQYKATVNYVDSLVGKGELSQVYAEWIKMEAEYSYLQLGLTKNIKTDSIDIKEKINIDGNLGINNYRDLLWKQMNNSLKKDNSIDNIIKVADANFTGASKDYVLYKFANQTLPALDAEKAKSDVAKLHDHFADKTYYTLLTSRYQDTYQTTTTAADQFLQPNGEIISLADLLAKYKGKMVYIDFWASWCMPCRAEFPSSHALKKRMDNDKVAFVYISIDKVQNDWLKANNEEKLSVTDSYLVLNRKESSLLNKYKLESIPRYFIMDKEGKIIHSDAPRPSSPEIEKLLR
ncbi:TlpA family protein disulfide reductase [Sphingobacterium lactis]|uniref:TlpA family protein disulfide reductase n=1 Tax=Sphingobacterium lactis TaxID=797291 RepID=UPI003DA4E08B